MQQTVLFCSDLWITRRSRDGARAQDDSRSEEMFLDAITQTVRENPDGFHRGQGRALRQALLFGSGAILGVALPPSTLSWFTSTSRTILQGGITTSSESQTNSGTAPGGSGG